MLPIAVVAAILGLVQASVLPLVPQLDGRIIGGTPIEITQAPYHVALLFDFFENGVFNQACGGSVISQTVILSAGHCAERTYPSQGRIRAGSTFHNSGGVVIDVSKLTQHPSYTGRLDYDVVLLALRTPLTLGSSIAIATLPAQDQVIGDGLMAYISGWGVPVEGGTTTSRLYQVSAPTVNRQQCMDAYVGFNPITERMFCIGNVAGGAGPCQGDSGGAAMIGQNLMGIASWGDGCGKPGKPAIFVRIPSVRNWIEANM